MITSMDPTLDPPYLIIKPGFSEDDFYRLADEDSNWEYLDGRIVMHSPASFRHERLFGFLLTLFNDFVGERGDAIVVGSRYPMRLDEKWSPEPEILVIRETNRDRVTKKRLEGPADLVVEIVSESDPRLDYREKLPRYREAGIEEIWIVDPFQHEVLQELRGPSGYEARTLSSGILSSRVVPGFWIDVRWLWMEKLPPTLACLKQILA